MGSNATEANANRTATLLTLGHVAAGTPTGSHVAGDHRPTLPTAIAHRHRRTAPRRQSLPIIARPPPNTAHRKCHENDIRKTQRNAPTCRILLGMTTTRRKPTMKTGYIVRAYRPRANATPTPPRVGDLMPFGEGPRPTLYRIGRVQPARAGIDDIDGDGVAISHYFRLDELDGKRDPFIWLELPAKYDVVRVTTSDYFANGQR